MNSSSFEWKQNPKFAVLDKAYLFSSIFCSLMICFVLTSDCFIVLQNVRFRNGREERNEGR